MPSPTHTVGHRPTIVDSITVYKLVLLMQDKHGRGLFSRGQF